MQLPGGVLSAGKRNRTFAFQPLTGQLELAVAESGRKHSGLPARVTAALAVALRQVGGGEPTWERVHGLSVGDRQFLMQRLAARLETDERWFTAACGGCGEDFDFSVRISAFPAKPAGRGFPFADVRTSFGSCRLRVPTGVDQEAVQDSGSEEEAIQKLVRRLVVGPVPEGIGDLTPDDLETIDAALEAAAPEATTNVQACCPACGRTNDVALDPYACLERTGESLLVEIHRLASAYKWSEPDILALPRSRRYCYLQLLDHERGMVT